MARHIDWVRQLVQLSTLTTPATLDELRSSLDDVPVRISRVEIVAMTIGLVGNMGAAGQLDRRRVHRAADLLGRLLLEEAAP